MFYTDEIYLKFGADPHVEGLDNLDKIQEISDRAKENDIILLLGKSHENSIIYKDYVMPYDEISEAQLALSELGYKL